MSKKPINHLRAFADTLYKIQLIKDANPQLETGELHPKIMNFMGPGTKFTDRISLNYKGKVGTKNYFLPSTIEDYFSVFHDLVYFIPDDSIKLIADMDFIKNQLDYGKWNINKLYAIAGIYTRVAERTTKNLFNLLLKNPYKVVKNLIGNFDETLKQWDTVESKLKDIQNSYNKYLDTVGYFELNEPVDNTYNKFVVFSGWTKDDQPQGIKKQEAYKEFYNKVEDFFNKYLPEKYGETKYKMPPLNLDNIKKVSYVPTVGKATDDTLYPDDFKYYEKKNIPYVNTVLKQTKQTEETQETNKEQLDLQVRSSTSKLKDVIQPQVSGQQVSEPLADDDEHIIPEEEIKAILEGRQIKPYETPIEIDDDDYIIIPDIS